MSESKSYAVRGLHIYGNFAFLGVVNIVTQSEESGGFAAVIDGDRFSGGVQSSAQNGDAQLDVNVAGWTSDTGEGAADADVEEDRISAVANFAYRGTALSYQVFGRDFRSQLPLEERNQAVSMRHHRQLARSWHADVGASYLRTEAREGERLFEGGLKQADIGVGWTQERMDWLIAISRTDAGIDRARISQDFGVIENASWESWSGSLQGQFQLRPDLTATAGARFDERIDLEATRWTPRLALVWQARQRHLLKTQYAEGFRAPTFFELFGLTQEGILELDFETIATLEMSYVYRDLSRTARVTLFTSDIENLIAAEPVDGPEGEGPPPARDPPPGDRPPGDPPPPRDEGGPPPDGAPGEGPPPPPVEVRIRNIAHAESRGLELEWEQQITEAMRWGASLSYARPRDNRRPGFEKDTPMGATEWLASVHALAKPTKNLLLAARLYHVGEQAGGSTSVDGYDRLDLHLHRAAMPVPGLTLRGGVKNLFDVDVRYLLNRPNGLQVSRHDPRWWWVRVGYDL